MRSHAVAVVLAASLMSAPGTRADIGPPPSCPDGTRRVYNFGYHCETICPDGTHGLRCDYGDERPECEGQYGHICVDDAPPGPCAEKLANAPPPTSMLVGAFVPQCTDDGEFEPRQCHGSTGHCWCVREDGSILDETDVGPAAAAQLTAEMCTSARAADAAATSDSEPEQLVIAEEAPPPPPPDTRPADTRGHNPRLGDQTGDGITTLLPLLLLCVCIGLATVCKLWLDGRSAKKRNAKLGAKLGDIEMDATILPADHPRSGVPVTVVGDGQPSRESRAAQNLLHISAELQKG